MLPQQFVSFCMFAGIQEALLYQWVVCIVGIHNILKCGYFSIVYYTFKYMSVLNGIAEAFMQDAIEKVKVLSDYATKGEVHGAKWYFYIYYLHVYSGLWPMLAMTIGTLVYVFQL